MFEEIEGIYESQKGLRNSQLADPQVAVDFYAEDFATRFTEICDRAVDQFQGEARTLIVEMFHKSSAELPLMSKPALDLFYLALGKNLPTKNTSI